MGEAWVAEGRPPSTIDQEEATYVSVDQEQKTKVSGFWLLHTYINF